MKKWFKANLNDIVRVKVTEEGEKVFTKFHEDLFLPHHPDWVPELKRDEDGWSSFHLWEFANIFGSSLYNGCKVPVETAFELEVNDVGNEQTGQ